ncbi:MAG TPA: LysM peptidoglycan-binding domain-containing protein [Acidimicrobiales bacterium]|nr:LysM peptidoglycan-binding domain-containing protein [Acidimicrobiales bacterium]
MHRSRLADVGRGTAALAGIVALVVGVPVLLLAWVGSPLPAEVPAPSEVADAVRDTYIPDSFLVKSLALVCWLVWAELLASLIVEAVALARGRKAGEVPLAGRLQRGAARLVATVALLGVLVATRGAGDRDRPAPSTLLPPDGSLVTYVTADVPVAAPVAPPDPVPAGPAPVYEVQRRDTLWDIAERHLGDPFRWTEIFEINRDRPQADGTGLTDPDVIYAGWVLELPADAAGLTVPPAPATGGPGPAPVGGSGTSPLGDGGTSPVGGSGTSPLGDGGMVLIDDGTGGSGGSGGDVVLVGESTGHAAGGASAGAAAADPDAMVLLPDPTGRAGDPVPEGSPVVAAPAGRPHDDEMASPPAGGHVPAARSGDTDD